MAFGDVAPTDSPTAQASPVYGGDAAMNAQQSPVDMARAQIGSLDYGSGNNTDCQTFTEDMTGSGWKGVSAVDAWNRQAPLQNTDFSQMQPGDAVYYAPDPENSGYGHTGIYTGDGTVVSATYDGIQELPVNAFQAAPMGFIPHSALMGGEGPRVQGPSANVNPALAGGGMDFSQVPSVIPDTGLDMSDSGLSNLFGLSGVDDQGPQLDLQSAANSGIDFSDVESGLGTLSSMVDSLDQDISAGINSGPTAHDTQLFLSTMQRSSGGATVDPTSSMKVDSPNGAAMRDYASTALSGADSPYVKTAAQAGSTAFGSLGSQEANILTPIFVRQIQVESGFNPSAVSPAGAVGIAQIMPDFHPDVDATNPQQSLSYAANLMANSVAAYGGNVAKALAAYNAGSGTVNSAISKGGDDWIDYIPDETRAYLTKIIGV